MKELFKMFAIATIILAGGSMSAQDGAGNIEVETRQEKKVRPLRLGAKIGFPNLVGGNLEYVTPLLHKKLALNLDYSYIKSDWLEIENVNYDDQNYEVEKGDQLNFKYVEGGLNYYFFKPGRGLYGGISYGVTDLQGTTSAEDSDNIQRTGSAIVDETHGSFNVKIGAKLGGLFYFRPEVGYSFSSLPKSFEAEVVFEDGSRKTQTIEFDTEGSPVDLLFSGLMLNIGFGFAF